MDSTDHLKSQIKDAFGHTDLYRILEVEKDAPAGAIKKAYMKAALKHHPDKGGEAAKFQALSVAHAILSDPERRMIYDEGGMVDDFEEDLDQNFTFWYDYFRKLTPKVTLSSIEQLEKEYIGSEEEKRDVIAAYEHCGGDVAQIMESIMFAEVGHEQRICDLLDEAIADGSIKSTKLYTKSRRQALESMPKKVAKKQRRGGGGDDLALMIAQKQKDRASALGAIFSKYGGDEVEMEDIPDEDFARARRSVSKQSAAHTKDKDKKQQPQHAKTHNKGASRK